MSGVVMDWPTAWAFIVATSPEDHHERCSWRTENGALLCDCDVLWDEYVRRGGKDPRQRDSRSAERRLGHPETEPASSRERDAE